MIPLMPRFLLLACLSALATVANAWIDTGHMVVARIAEQRLSLDVRKECERLLNYGGNERTSTFVTSACWADDFKTGQNGPWHYTNEHFRTDGKPTRNQPLAENVVWAIERFSKIVANRSLPNAERAEALRFLIHFVGDVHQPMHNIARDTDTFPSGDRGGNDFPVVSPPNLKPEPRNLHFLWDIGAGLFPSVKRPLTGEGQATIQSIADAVTTQFPHTSFPSLSVMDPAKWSEEGVALAKTAAYADLTPGSVPTDRYLERARAASAKQAALAGYRLAALLNRLLKQD